MHILFTSFEPMMISSIEFEFIAFPTISVGAGDRGHGTTVLVLSKSEGKMMESAYLADWAYNRHGCCDNGRE
jgi:hypothetical protein